MTSRHRPALYLKRSCPFCLKLRIFLTEARIADDFVITVFDDGDEIHTSLRARMMETGQEPSFPAAELTPGTLETGTDALIARFAEQSQADPKSMPLLAYYEGGLLAQHVAMFKRLRALEAGQAHA